MQPRLTIGGLVAGSLLVGGGSHGAATAEAVTIGAGHVDAGAARVVGGRLRAFVKDASSGPVRWRRPSDVTIRVVDRARTRLPSDGRLRFAGRPGAVVWLIPQVQKRGIVWAGWNTEAITRGRVRGGVRWTLQGVRGPGRVAVWQTGSFGSSDVWFTSGSGPKAKTLPLDTHAHTNWSFARRGSYRLRFRLSATSRSGRSMSAAQTMRIRVG